MSHDSDTPELDPDERLLFVGQGSLVVSDGPNEQSTSGTVLVTDRRLEMLGEPDGEMGMESIADASVIGERLVVNAGDGRVLVVDHPQPHELLDELRDRIAANTPL